MCDNDDELGQKHELVETLKNGPLSHGECLLIVNGKTVRIGIQNLTLDENMDFSAPTFTLGGVIFSDPRVLYEAIYEMRYK